MLNTAKMLNPLDTGQYTEHIQPMLFAANTEDHIQNDKYAEHKQHDIILLSRLQETVVLSRLKDADLILKIFE